MNNFNAINLWPNILGHNHYENNIQPIKEIIIKELANNEQTTESITTVNGKQITHSIDPWNWSYEEWQPIKKFVSSSLDQYVQTVYPHIQDSINPLVKRSWAIAYDENGYQEPHCHPQMDLSGLLTIQPSSEGGEIVFTNPSVQSSYTNFQPYAHKFRPEAGDLILWPAWWLHHTLPTKGPDQKIVISFDLKLYG